MKALISVSDKTGIVEFAHQLSEFGFEILSTGGTSKTLAQAEVNTEEVSDITKYPEILSGRVKTLHPKIFGGILSLRSNPSHKSEMEKHDIPYIDWVVVNLYPFEKMSMEEKVSKPELIEFIDIGGVSLLRAAAKNFQDVVVLSDPADYAPILEEFKENKSISLKTKKMLAAKAFSHTAHYDSMIAKFFSRNDIVSSPSTNHADTTKEPFPNELSIGLRKICDLRYGENSHQKASLYKESGEREWGVVHAEKLQGKDLSFNNYLDLDSAWQIVNAISADPKGHKKAQTSCAIIKHTNPCGVAIASTPYEAFQTAFQTDPLSAFGGIIGFSTTVDAQTATEIAKSFFECVIAPNYSAEALEIFKKKQNLRILRQKTMLSLPYEFDIKKISGGFLVQEQDVLADENRKVVTKRQPTPDELYSLDFGWKICKHVKSNAVVLTKGTVSVGVGCGQTSRIDSLKSSILKMEDLKNSPNSLLDPRSPLMKMPLVMASDAFFPFRDCVDHASKAGVSAIIQPGGSIRDQESIDAANEYNIAMIFTGIRHFKH